MTSNSRALFEDRTLKSRTSVSSLSGLMRLGRTRTNRTVTLPQVNKRLQTFEKDYRKLLACVCRNLSVPVLLIQNMVEKIQIY